MIKYKAYIDGEFVDSDNRVEITSPLNLEVYGSVPGLKKDEINRAYSSARNAFNSWKRTPSKERAKKLMEFNKLLLGHKKELAEIMHNEVGKNLDEATVEVERTHSYIKETLDEWKIIEEKKEKIGNKVSIQKRVPLGVILAISPFNYPVNLSMAKVIPALLAGNTVVFKAATNGSLTGGFITTLLAKVKLPNGVYNYVTGRGRDIGDALLENKEIDMVTFTGGVKVGKNIAQKIHMKPLVLELGGNDGAYVRNDADLDLALNEVVAGSYGFAGQRCTAIKRLILHKDIADDFTKKLIDRIKDLKINPLIDLAATNYVKELYDNSIKRGDELLYGGKFNKNRIQPTLIKTTSDSRLWKEEPFGPVLPLIVVGNDEEAMREMNNTDFGLQNSIFTKDNDWAVSVASNIESGSININAKSSRGPDKFPFSGIKNSGFGIQGIKYALESMSRIVNIVNNKQ